MHLHVCLTFALNHKFNSPEYQKNFEIKIP